MTGLHKAVFLSYASEDAAAAHLRGAARRGRRGVVRPERVAARRALAIDPNLAQAHYALGNICRFFDYDWSAAQSEYEKVIALDPTGENSTHARENMFGVVAQKTGRLNDTLGLYREPFARNPLDTDLLDSLAMYQRSAGQLAESAATFRRRLELNSNYAFAQTYYGLTLLLMGKNAEALAATVKESDEGSKLSVLACVYWNMGEHAKSDVALGTLEREFSYTFAYTIAAVHAWRGEAGATFNWLDRAFSQRDGQLINVKMDPGLRNVHGDPRYQAFLVKMKLNEN